MNESRLQGLLEDFQDDALSEADCRELMEWFDGGRFTRDRHLSMNCESATRWRHCM